MARVDYGQTEIARRDNAVMGHVAGHEGLCPFRRRLDQGAAGAGHHGHRLHIGVAVSGDADPDMTEGIGDDGVDGAEGSRERAVPADVAEPGLGVSPEGPHVAEIEESGEGVGRAAGSGVEVGVGHQQVDSGAHQPIGARTRGATRHQLRGRGEEQGVVGDEEVDRLRLDARHHFIVDLVTDRHRGDAGIGITELEAHRVPVRSSPGSGPLGKGMGDVGYGGHGTVIVGCAHMELAPALTWEPPSGWQRLTAIESHTGGEPFRVIVDGIGEIPGGTMMERRRHAQRHLDGLRRATILEPRGHSDMYGGWIGPPARPDSDLSVLFVHNEGFSTMCGHGIIAVAKVVLDTGIIGAGTEIVELRIDTPAGQVSATSTKRHGRVVNTSFRNVASFAPALDQELAVPGLGMVRYDLGFGGAFYAFVASEDLGLDLTDAAAATAAGRAVKQAIVVSGEPSHPIDPDLGFLYGVIFTGPAGDRTAHSRHVCVFADGEVDRSPTGTGVSARLAILHRRGQISVGEELTFESIVGSRFTGRIADVAEVGEHAAVIPEVAGTAHITGRAEIWIDPEDRLGEGFLLR